ncbi:MAG: phospholipase D-like domain-containing protein, partial [Chloroflexota bacterium]
MPRIFDNIQQHLLPALQQTIQVSYRADFCVGYFNLRGWKNLQDQIDRWAGGENSCCRLLVGMQKLPQEELRELMSVSLQAEISNEVADRIRKRLAAEFREQLTIGTPTNEDETALRRLAEQIKAKKVVVKLFLRHPLHAKLYLLFRNDKDAPRVGYLGSSNLTLAGLSAQGELNVDVVDTDASAKLAKWFNDRWDDRFCVDISKELVQIIGESWAREDLIPPYYIYLKMAYHLSQEARTGISEFRIPGDLYHKLLEFQIAAVKIAAHHIHKRNGVLIGDVVGMGKTLVGTAIARIFDEDLGFDTLIICPKNLVKMWEDYRDKYRLRAKVLSISRVIRELPALRRYRLVMIDESHNLRNREGKRYGAIKDYIERNESQVVMLTATPYNKTYLDLSSQLRLFVPEDAQLSTKPDHLLREIGEVEFVRRHQAPLRSLAAFEKSENPEDWQELMRLYLVRCTRTFIKANYAQTDEQGRKYLLFPDGQRSYFPERLPKTVKFKLDEGNPNDQYVRMFTPDVVDAIGHLHLPRYGLGQNQYVKEERIQLTAGEKKILDNLSRAGKRLIGFSRTNLFKRLESSGYAFLLSIERHILRNYIYLHALNNALPLPIGTQDAMLLDSRYNDEDKEGNLADLFDIENKELDDDEEGAETEAAGLLEETGFQREAKKVYEQYHTKLHKRFHWIRPDVFKPTLAKHLREDADALMNILQCCGAWDPAKDAKLENLYNL